jgi:hypothetical protein
VGSIAAARVAAGAAIVNGASASLAAEAGVNTALAAIAVQNQAVYTASWIAGAGTAVEAASIVLPRSLVLLATRQRPRTLLHFSQELLRSQVPPPPQ